MASTGGSLRLRVQRLLDPPAPHASMPATIAASMVLLVAIAGSMGAWQTQNAPPPPLRQKIETGISFAPPTPQTPRPAVALSPQQTRAEQRLRQELAVPYRKWLDQDVAYIIMSEERAAFEKLQTDEEREQFIEQFWLRRDPTPGTVENEFKQEYYRRIAFANEHFSGGIPGWKTDRGRIYILYGPPDAQESHPSGGSYTRPAAQGGGVTSTYPFEVWTYKLIEGIGKDVSIEFVDPTMSGEYRMTMDPSEKDALLASAGVDAWTTGKATANVQMLGGNSAVISVPLSSYGNRKVMVTCQVRSLEGQVVASYRDEIQGPVPLYTRTIAIQPGAYRVEVAVLDGVERRVSRATVDFSVK
jgi:GWxTD domain-containing protein